MNLCLPALSLLMMLWIMVCPMTAVLQRGGRGGRIGRGRKSHVMRGFEEQDRQDLIPSNFELYQPCRSSFECQAHIAHSHCDYKSKECVCQQYHVPFNNSLCLPPSLIGYGCVIDQQCQVKVKNSLCVNGLCACKENHVKIRVDKCLPPVPVGDYCLDERMCTLHNSYSYCKWIVPPVYGKCACPLDYYKTQDGHCLPHLGSYCEKHVDCEAVTPNSYCHKEYNRATCACRVGFEPSSNYMECNEIKKTDCPKSAFQCDDGTCLPRSSVCNGHWECPDGSDEARCYTEPPVTEPPVTELPVTELPVTELPVTELSVTELLAREPHVTEPPVAEHPVTEHPVTELSVTESHVTEPPVTEIAETEHPLAVISLGKYCQDDLECQARDPYSHCLNGTCECISPNDKCNAKNTGCYKDAFQCRDGYCISWFFVCDSQMNCPDNSDEDECITHNCPKYAFQCDDGTCLPRSSVCNGHWECPDGSDEARCYTGIPCDKSAFRCRNGQCLPQYTFCNAVQDCADGSDEIDEICNEGQSCTNYTTGAYQCDNDRCRSTAILCSGMDGCGDNSDETACEVCSCPKPEW